jgi:hypothetical protein
MLRSKIFENTQPKGFLGGSAFEVQVDIDGVSIAK